MGNLYFGTEASHLLAGEVHPIVGNDGVREPETAYDILSKKFDYLVSCDIGELHRFYPLSKVVRSYQ